MLKSPAFSTSFLESRKNQKLKLRKTRRNPGFLASLLAGRIIFGKKTQAASCRSQDAHLIFVGCAVFLCPRFVAGIFFCQHFSGGKLPLLRRELHFCEVRAFSCPCLWFQVLPPSAEVIGSFSRLFLFFAVPSEPKSLGSLIYEPSLPQKRWFSKRDAASRGSCISFS